MPPSPYSQPPRSRRKCNPFTYILGRPRIVLFRIIQPRYLFAFIFFFTCISVWSVLPREEHYLKDEHRDLPWNHERNYLLLNCPQWLWSILQLRYPEGYHVDPPRIHDELLNGRHPSEWAVPVLSRPTYDHITTTPPVPRYPIEFSELKDTSEYTISPPSSRVPKPTNPVLLSLHIFSTNTPRSRRRRAFLRKYSPLNSVPREYQHLFDIRFVMGLPVPGQVLSPEVEEEERAIQEEVDTWDDLIRLESLKDGDNMNNGKTWEWLHWVGSEKGRQARWVIKCDDDVRVPPGLWTVLSQSSRIADNVIQTMPIFPNLLPYLTAQPPTQPTYLGSSMGHHGGYVYYYEGMLYGFSWGVVRCLPLLFFQADHSQSPLLSIGAQLPSLRSCLEHNPLTLGRSNRLPLQISAPIFGLPSGTRMLEWGSSWWVPQTTPLHRTDDTGSQFSLPTSPMCRIRHPLPSHSSAIEPFAADPADENRHDPCDPHSPLPGGWGMIPPNPDPRSGLVRLDFVQNLGDFFHWWVAGAEKAVAWHHMKDEEVSPSGQQRWGRLMLMLVSRPYRTLSRCTSKPCGSSGGEANSTGHHRGTSGSMPRILRESSRSTGGERRGRGRSPVIFREMYTDLATAHVCPGVPLVDESMNTAGGRSKL